MRRARTGDPLEAVARLQNLSFSRPWSAEAIGWELRHTDVARLFVLEDTAQAADGSTLVAYCGCWLVLDELHVNSLAVLPEARSRGHARRLLLDVFQEMTAEGATAATLEVRRSNTAALALYRGLGFQIEAERPNYYQQPSEDALILWHRDLGSFGGRADSAASRRGT